MPPCTRVRSCARISRVVGLRDNVDPGILSGCLRVSFYESILMLICTSLDDDMKRFVGEHEKVVFARLSC
jgi:hypothetical protein